MTSPIKLKMTGKLAYEDEITVAQAARIIAFLDSGPLDGGDEAEPLGPVQTPRTRRQSQMSPRDALESSGAKTNPERIVAFALYVEQAGGKETFTLDDVKPLFRQARESTPANLSRDLDNAIRQGWVAESDTKGEYYVKDHVLGVLESGFDGVRAGRSGKTRAKTSTGRRTRKASIATPSAFEGKEISPVVDGLINYHKVKTKTDKYLWAVNAAKLLGVEAVTNLELVWLSDKLGDGISASDLTGYYRSNYRRGYVNKTNDRRARVLPAGVEYLAALANGATE